MAKPLPQQPHNIEAEQAFLGSLELEPRTISRAARLVRPADFFNERHSAIYQAMLHLDSAGIPIDLITLADQLNGQLAEVGGSTYLTQLLSLTPTANNLDYYAGIVRKFARLRRLIAGAGKIARLAHTAAERDSPDEALALAETALLALVREERLGSVRPVGELARSYLDRVKNRPESGLLGLSTGLAGLDELCGRLHPADLIVLAGEPGTLKTSLALSVARSAGRAGKRVALFSLESSADQLVQRLLSSETGLSPQRLRLGDVGPEWPALAAAGERLAQMNVYVDDTPGLLVAELRSKARWLHYLWGLDLIIVNYLQLMRSGQKLSDRDQELAAISRALKALARELNLPLLAVSMLAPTAQGAPELHQLGPVQYEADIVWFCKLAGDTLLITQTRWRDGPAGGTVQLYRDPERHDFSELK